MRSANNTTFPSEPTSQWTIPLDMWTKYFEGKNPRFSHTLYSTLKTQTQDERAHFISKILAITGPGHSYQLCVPVEIRKMRSFPDDAHDCSTTVLEAISRIFVFAGVDAPVDAPDVDAMDIDEEGSSHQQHQQHHYESRFPGTTASSYDQEIAQKLEQKLMAERELFEAERQCDEQRWLCTIAGWTGGGIVGEIEHGY
ncbi:hypothetical protein PRZ48_011830 [Zasmidium cellare]|uniref:Uncharacterized protein n=1 Tax=Zasmidium cellare TaxID=395010 RepID=A0ABR0E7J0_ZASCE|nr:hypothetical protein PRZ48_011830 [Zasmidium cellare]